MVRGPCMYEMQRPRVVTSPAGHRSLGGRRSRRPVPPLRIPSAGLRFRSPAQGPWMTPGSESFVAVTEFLPVRGPHAQVFLSNISRFFSSPAEHHKNGQSEVRNLQIYP
jgi:hypothetical protein